MTRYSVLFCDDIRQEVTGKHLLIGVYSGDLIPGSVPSTFPLSVMVKVQGVVGHHHFQVRLFAPDGEVILDIEDDIEVPEDNGGFPLAFVGAPMRITQSGEITLEFSLDRAVPEKIASLEVRIPRSDT